MIREFEFYHGVVFSRLIHAYKGQVIIKPYPTESNASYVLNDRIGLFIKYSTNRMTPWSFNFKREHQEEISEMHLGLSCVFVLLVCNEDGIVCLSYDELRQILDENFDDTEFIRIHRKPREKYSVSGTDGRLKLKIGESDFPKKLFESAEKVEKSTILNFLGIK